MGKGDTDRTADYEVYRRNWKAVFGDDDRLEKCEGCGAYYDIDSVKYIFNGAYRGLCALCHLEAQAAEADRDG